MEYFKLLTGTEETFPLIYGAGYLHRIAYWYSFFVETKRNMWPLLHLQMDRIFSCQQDGGNGKTYSF